MNTQAEADRAVSETSKNLWSAITDYADGSCDHTRVQHFLDLHETALEVAALVRLRAEFARERSVLLHQIELRDEELEAP